VNKKHLWGIVGYVAGAFTGGWIARIVKKR
jgi:hypothetical protein